MFFIIKNTLLPLHNEILYFKNRELTSDKSTHFDVVLTLSWPPNESGVYLAHRFHTAFRHFFQKILYFYFYLKNRFKAALVLLSTLQVNRTQYILSFQK